MHHESGLECAFLPTSLEVERPVEEASLLKYSDIKGVLHNHTTYSDGLNSVEEMALYAMEIGMEYLGICDHSKAAQYAGGLKEEEIEKQHREIDVLNDKLGPFKIFKGIECDILGDGSLDYNESQLIVNVTAVDVLNNQH
mgnify:CR=1 FL=1